MPLVSTKAMFEYLEKYGILLWNALLHNIPLKERYGVELLFAFINKLVSFNRKRVLCKIE
jgi:hypothetical protein